MGSDEGETYKNWKIEKNAERVKAGKNEEWQ